MKSVINNASPYFGPPPVMTVTNKSIGKDKMEKNAFFERIKANIDQHDYHVTTVTGGACPRFSYTIGLKDKIGYELIFAGGENMSAETISYIFGELYKQLFAENNDTLDSVKLPNLGSFTLSPVDSSWSQLLMLGAMDFYQTSEIKACQILPEQSKRTLDVPNMTASFNASVESIWKWLAVEWPYPIPYNSTVVTNIASLYGEKTTEATRWEEGEWEMFISSDVEVDKSDLCVLPIAALLGIDNSIEPVLNLKIGKALWRDAVELIWHEWN